MNFRSDNIGAVAPSILDAVVAANARSAAGYGEDEITARLDGLFGAVFETEVRVLPVLTGTAANALALAAATPPYGAIYCHEAAHIQSDECGAPELFTGRGQARASARRAGQDRSRGPGRGAGQFRRSATSITSSPPRSA